MNKMSLNYKPKSVKSESKGINGQNEKNDKIPIVREKGISNLKADTKKENGETSNIAAKVTPEASKPDEKPTAVKEKNITAIESTTIDTSTEIISTLSKETENVQLDNTLSKAEVHSDETQTKESKTAIDIDPPCPASDQDVIENITHVESTSEINAENHITIADISVDDQMQSFEVDNDDTNPTNTTGKVLKLKSTPAISACLEKPENKMKSFESYEVAVPLNISPRKDLKPPTSLRLISGRRSIRDSPNLSSIKYKQNCSLDDTRYSSFSFDLGRKRNHYALEPSSVHKTSSDCSDSSKRTRFEEKGIVSLLTLPLNLLRSQFMKTTTQRNTNNRPKTEEEGVETVTLMDAEEGLKNLHGDHDISSEINENPLKEDKSGDNFTKYNENQLSTSSSDTKNKSCNVM